MEDAHFTDMSRKSMGQAIDRFIARLGPGDVALFYYSGHGMQVDGENYPIPTDYDGKDESDVRYDTQPAGKFRSEWSAAGRT